MPCNAIKFTSTGGVRVTASREQDGTAVIGVSDTGVGIAPEQVGSIFDEFAQLHNPERDRCKGYGLGLAICRRLVDALGGRITVKSQPGHGSLFTVRLAPSSVAETAGDAAVSPDGKQTHEANAGRMRLTGLRVLLVEDHQPTRESTAQMLRDEGAVVREATDAASARRLLREEAWGAILLDMMLPDFDGREILKDLTAHRPPSLGPVLVTTGDLTAERQAEVRRLGADSLLPKPINMARLIAFLQERTAGNRRN